MKIILCDDDNYTLRMLERLIKNIHPSAKVITCSNGEEALDEFAKEGADLVFIDIDMPVMDGMTAAKLIRSLDREVGIIFITAYRDYALDSYDIKAQDYILKPIDLDRVTQNLQRIIDTTPKRQNPLGDKLLLKDKQEYNLIDKNTILFVEKDKNKLIIKTNELEYTSQCTLGEIEALLGEGFIRGHKSYIINLSNVSRMELYGDTSYIVYFKDTPESITALITKENIKYLSSLQ